MDNKKNKRQMNKIIVTGNIVRDAVIRESNSRKAINFVVAVNENYKKQDGTKVEKATFYSCTLWKDTMHSTEIAKYLTKGIKVLVEGKPSAELYKTKDDKTAIDNRINVNQVELLSFEKKEGEAEAKQAETVNASENENVAVEDLPF